MGGSCVLDSQQHAIRLVVCWTLEESKQQETEETDGKHRELKTLTQCGTAGAAKGDRLLLHAVVYSGDHREHMTSLAALRTAILHW
jgi:hypothetical protein